MADAPIREIEQEIKAGLPNQREDLDDALFNREFYKADFSRFPPRAPGTSYDEVRYPRTSPVMRRIVKVLTANLYKNGPVRLLSEHKDASEWLNAVYRANCVDALFQAADRWAMVGDVAMFRAEGTTDPDKPVKLYVYDRSQYCVWVDPDDPRDVVAVATLDVFDEQRRVRFWTPQVIQTWVTKKWNPTEPNAPTAYSLLKTEPNPYGVLPFSFVHVEYPDSEWYTEGPGSNLRALNDCSNFALTEGFDCLRYNARPVIVFKNVRAGYRPPTPIKPGDIWDLPAQGEADESDPKQTAEYLQADVAFIAATWDDVLHFLDHSLEMHGVPPGTIRMDQNAVASGIARVAEHIPLILWAEGRQRDFAKYEDETARMVLRVGAAHLARNAPKNREYAVTAAKLLEAANHLDLCLRWADMWPDLPGQDRDTADDFALQTRLTSRTKILMRRHKMTREEAEAELDEIAEDLEREKKLFAALEPVAPPAGQADDYEDDDDELEDPADAKGAADPNDDPDNTEEQL